MKVFKWALAGVGGLAVAAIVAVSALGGGISQAQQPDPAGGQIHGAYAEALAAQLGISVDELLAARKAAWDQVIDNAVASGRITPEQGEEMKENPGKARRGLVRKAAAGIHGIIAGAIDVAAETIGITRDEVKEGLTNGQSLGQIAEANGSSVAELKAALIGAAEARLAEAVSSGRISQEQADRIEAGLAEKIDALIARQGGMGSNRR